MDAAELDPQEAAAVNVGGTQHAAELGAPLVVFSSDYVFDGRKREPYVESDPPNPLSVYGRTKLHGEAAAGEDAWIVRSSWLFGWTSRNFVRTMLELGAERSEVSVVDDQRGCPTYVGHLAAAVTELVERYRSEYPAFVPVSYVEFEPQGVNGIVANPAWYRAQNLKVLVQTAPYTIYDVRPLWSSPG